MWLPWTFIVAQERTLARQKTSNTNEMRHALVIGNSTYRVSPLSNPANDAKDMARVLTELGFEVSLVLNATREQMKQAIRVFVERLRRGDVGLFYYAGHGMQVEGHNYLIPVDADITRKYEINLESISANRILGGMKEAGAAVRKVIAAMGGQVNVDQPRYLAATFRTPVFGFVDDLEFRFDDENQTIHLRSASRSGYSDRGVNRKRIRRLRKMF
mgnify:CR=1 FL=1